MTVASPRLASPARCPEDADRSFDRPRVLQASLTTQEQLVKGRAASDSTLGELRAALAESRAEAAALRARNTDLEREVATLRRQSTSGGGATPGELAPRTPVTRSSAMRDNAGGLSPLSPLLAGLDESNPNRSRGSAYWRRGVQLLTPRPSPLAPHPIAPQPSPLTPHPSPLAPHPSPLTLTLTLNPHPHPHPHLLPTPSPSPLTGGVVGT